MTISNESMATGRVKRSSKYQVYKGAKSAVIMAASEEYRQINTNTIQVAISDSDKSAPIGAIAPNAVATPLPPLNLKKIGNIWPKQAAIAMIPKEMASTPNLNAT